MSTNNDDTMSFQDEYAAMKESGYVCSQRFKDLLKRHGYEKMFQEKEAEKHGWKFDYIAMYKELV